MECDGGPVKGGGAVGGRVERVEDGWRGDQCRGSRDGGHNEGGGRLPSVLAVKGGGEEGR